MKILRLAFLLIFVIHLLPSLSTHGVPEHLLGGVHPLLIRSSLKLYVVFAYYVTIVAIGHGLLKKFWTFGVADQVLYVSFAPYLVTTNIANTIIFCQGYILCNSIISPLPPFLRSFFSPANNFAASL